MSGASVERITVDEAARRLEAAEGADAPLLVDVREAYESEQLRAIGATLIPLSVFQVGYQQLPRDRPILLICQTGQRSYAAGAFLVGQGFHRVANVEGGTMAWARAGLPTLSGPPEAGE